MFDVNKKKNESPPKNYVSHTHVPTRPTRRFFVLKSREMHNTVVVKG